MIRLRQGFGGQGRVRADRGAELGAIVLFCLGVELACLIAWIFG